VSYRLHDPQRQTDRVGQEHRHKPVVDRDGQATRNHVRDGHLVAEGLAQVSPDDLAQPLRVGDIPRLVVAIQGGELEALVGGDVRPLTGTLSLNAAALAHARHLRLHERLFEGAARHHPRHEEHEDRDPDEGGGDEKESADEVVAHLGFLQAKQTANCGGRRATIEQFPPEGKRGEYFIGQH